VKESRSDAAVFNYLHITVDIDQRRKGGGEGRGKKRGKKIVNRGSILITLLFRKKGKRSREKNEVEPCDCREERRKKTGGKGKFANGATSFWKTWRRSVTDLLFIRTGGEKRGKKRGRSSVSRTAMPRRLRLSTA